MSNRSYPWAGRCRCGRVRLAVSAPAILTMACHCTGCQRMSASAFSLSAAFPSAAFAVTQGEPVIGGIHGAARHFHCEYCMSWLFTRPDGMDWFVNVRATMFDDHQDFVPFLETYTREKLPWATTPAVHSYEGLPSMEDYGELMKAFAKQGAWA